MSRQVRRQHTVSKFYLRGFANDHEQVARIELPGAPRLTLSINDATVIKDFYTVPLSGGTTSDMFETSFADIEGAASAALAEALDGTWPLNDDQREALASWIALQHMRGEGPRADQTQMYAELIRLVVGTAGKEALRGHISAAEERDVTDAELDAEWVDLTKPGGPTLEHDVWDHMRTLVGVWQGMTAQLAASHWVLFVFTRRILVTSDHPVTLAVGPDHPSSLGVGVATADAIVTPLSRRMTLAILPRRRTLPDLKLPGSTLDANIFNQQTVRGARRYVYLHPDDVLDPRIVLHEPVVGGGMRMSNIDGLISEEGLFANVDWDSPPPPVGEPERFSLADLPWPIPNRRRV